MVYRKITISFTLLMVILLFVSNAGAFGAEKKTITNLSVTYRDIQIWVDGQPISCEEPFVLDTKNVIMVPVRTVAEAIGMDVTWEEKNKIVRINVYNKNKIIIPPQARKPGTFKKTTLPIFYDQIQIYLGKTLIQGEEPFILDHKGLVMVPLRTIVEGLGKSVVWDRRNNRVYIGSIPSGINITGDNLDDYGAATIKVPLEEMTVLRNVGGFFRQEKPFTIATEKYNQGLGVRLDSGVAEIVVRTHSKYKTFEGWLGVDDETNNTSGGFFFSVFTDAKEVPSIIETEGGAEGILNKSPQEYDYRYHFYQENNISGIDEDGQAYNAYRTTYPMNANLYEKTPIFLQGPIYPASYAKYINQGLVDISDALTVTIRVTWVGITEGEYADLTAVLGNFKFIK